MNTVYSAKKRVIKEINNILAKKPGAIGIELPELSCGLKREFRILIPILENLIRDGSILVSRDDNPGKLKSGDKEIERQIKLLNEAFTYPEDLSDVLSINEEKSVKISLS